MHDTESKAQYAGAALILGDVVALCLHSPRGGDSYLACFEVRKKRRREF